VWGAGAEEQCPVWDGLGGPHAGWAARGGNAAQREDGRLDTALAAALTPKPL